VERMMCRILVLLLSIVIFSGCATGQNASEKINEQDDNGILEITSEPSGAFIEILEDEDINERAKTGNKYKTTGKQGVTPYKIKLDVNKALRYFIKYQKEGFNSEIVEVWLKKMPFMKEDASKKKIGKALGPAAGVIPILAVPTVMLSNPPAIFEDIIIFSANPVNVVLKPIK